MLQPQLKLYWKRKTLGWIGFDTKRRENDTKQGKTISKHLRGSIGMTNSRQETLTGSKILFSQILFGIHGSNVWNTLVYACISRENRVYVGSFGQK